MFVKSNLDDHEVALFERDARHPSGEVFIDRTDQVYEVGETPLVKRRIKRGQLVPVDKKVPGDREIPAVEPVPAVEAEVETAVVVVEPETLIDQGPVDDRPLTKIKGIGPATAGKLYAVGIKTVSDLAAVKSDEYGDLAFDTGYPKSTIAGWVVKAREA